MRSKASESELIERFVFSEERTGKLGALSDSTGERIASRPGIKTREYKIAT